MAVAGATSVAVAGLSQTVHFLTYQGEGAYTATGVLSDHLWFILQFGLMKFKSSLLRVCEGNGSWQGGRRAWTVSGCAARTRSACWSSQEQFRLVLVEVEAVMTALLYPDPRGGVQGRSPGHTQPPGPGPPHEGPNTWC